MNVAALHGRVIAWLLFDAYLFALNAGFVINSSSVTQVATAVDSSISEAKAVWARWCAIVLDLGLWGVTELSYVMVSGECVCMCACVPVCIFEAKTVCYVVLWVWWCGSCLRECFAVMVVCVWVCMDACVFMCTSCMRVAFMVRVCCVCVGCVCAPARVEWGCGS